MPVSAKCIQHNIRHWLLAFVAFRAEAVRMTSDAPGVVFLLDEWSVCIECLFVR